MSTPKLSSHPNTSTLLAHWSFNGTLDDVSSNQVGPAVIVGSNVSLEFEDLPLPPVVSHHPSRSSQRSSQPPPPFSPSPPVSSERTGYIKMRNPGYLNLPYVNIQSDSFTFAFSLRMAAGSTDRQILYSNWTSGQWQFITRVSPTGTLIGTLRRNMQTNGSNPEQDLVEVTSDKPVPVGTWVNVEFSYDASLRTYSIYINQRKSGSSVVRPSITDLTLHTSNVKYVQFGNKADDFPLTGNLNADLRNLRIFKFYA